MIDKATYKSNNYLAENFAELFNSDRVPGDLSESGIASFLEHLALKRNVAESTQALSLNALVFFFEGF